jgi:hypothetical protein
MPSVAAVPVLVAQVNGRLDALLAAAAALPLSDAQQELRLSRSISPGCSTAFPLTRLL